MQLRKILPSAFCLVSLIALGPAACGGDDPSFSNRAACENFIDTYNALECVDDTISISAEQVCASYEDSAEVDCSAIFDCWAGNLACEDVGGTSIPGNYTLDCPTTCE